MGTAVNDDAVRWYVLSANYRNEVKIRDDLRRLGFDCYLPMRYELKERLGKKKRLLVPAINGMVFVKSTKSALEEYITTTKLPTFFRMSGMPGQKKPIIVPDRDMENFMRVTQQVEEQLSYFRPDEIKLRVGDKIRVHGGVFDGVEGVLMRVPGKRSKQLVVSIPEISAVAVSLSPEVVELVDQPAGKSTDIDADLKRLFTLAYEKQFAPPDRVAQENEYNLLVIELRRTLQRVEPYKGYTAQRQAELALPVYIATKALELDANEATQRLLSAINSLKATSLLRLRLQLYYALLNPDASVLESVKTRVEEWKKAPLSNQQRLFKEELSQLLNQSRKV
jgi:transcription antitermination factor NusG